MVVAVIINCIHAIPKPVVVICLGVNAGSRLLPYAPFNDAAYRWLDWGYSRCKH